MSFSGQQSISKIIHNHSGGSQGFEPGTTPASTVGTSALNLYWYGSGDDGVYTIAYSVGTWGSAAKIPAFPGGQGNSVGLSASPFNTGLYVFATGSHEKDGLEYANLQQSADSAQSLGIDMSAIQGSIPACAVFEGLLYAFWVDYADNRIRYATSNNGIHWSDPTDPGILSDIVNPAIGGVAAIACRNTTRTDTSDIVLHLFWGQDSRIHHATFDGQAWDTDFLGHGIQGVPAVAINAATPSAADQLLLVWNGAGDDGLWYATSADDFQSQTSMAQQIGGQGVAANTSPCVSYFPQENQYYVFWNGRGDDGTWFSSGTPDNS